MVCKRCCVEMRLFDRRISVWRPLVRIYQVWKHGIEAVSRCAHGYRKNFCYVYHLLFVEGGSECLCIVCFFVCFYVFVCVCVCVCCYILFLDCANCFQLFCCSCCRLYIDRSLFLLVFAEVCCYDVWISARVCLGVRLSVCRRRVCGRWLSGNGCC